MIFVTVGTTSFPFDRLLTAVDKVVENLKNSEELVVQKGMSQYQFKYSQTKAFKELPFAKMIDYLKKARVIICHGGPATNFLALKYGQNLPLVVPRRQKFGEHVDEHELAFARFLEERGEIKAVFPHDNLASKIQAYLCRPVQSMVKKRNIATKDLIKKLTKYTDSLV